MASLHPSDGISVDKDSISRVLGPTIYSQALECERLFLSYSEISSPYAARVSACQHRFLTWASFLGVFASESASLDRRLEFSPEIKELVMAMLRVLIRNLERAVSVHKTHTSEAVEDDGAMYGITGAVDRLQRIAVAIRESPRTDEVERVRNFASKQKPDGFSGILTAMMQFLFPDAESALRVQLVESIVYRRHRMLWNRRHSKKLGQQRKTEEETQRIKEETTATKAGQSSGQSAIPSAQRQLPLKVKAASVYSSTLPSVRPLGKASRLLQIQQEDQHDDLRSARSSNPPPRAQYPELPIVPPGESKISCRFCLSDVAFPPNAPHAKQEKIWREHLNTDLRPYVCVSEECRNFPTSFSSDREWKEHMNTSHGAEWARYIHRIKWSCPFCGDEAGTFSSEELLIRHLTQDQAENHPLTLDDFNLSKIKSKGRVASPVPANYCPLCGPPPWLKPGKVSKDADVLSGNPESLHLHFVGHLQHLALLSISWWDADVGAAIDSPDSGYGSADAIGLNSEIDDNQPQETSSSLHLGSADLAQLETRRTEIESQHRVYRDELAEQQKQLWRQLQPDLDKFALERCQQLRDQTIWDAEADQDTLKELEALHEQLRREAEAVTPQEKRLEMISGQPAEPRDSDPAEISKLWKVDGLSRSTDSSHDPIIDHMVKLRKFLDIDLPLGSTISGYDNTILCDALRDAAIVSGPRGGVSLAPLENLDKIVARTVIEAFSRALVASVSSVSDDDQNSIVRYLTDQVCSPLLYYLPESGEEIMAPRRKVFAVLTLIHRPSAIVSFIKEEVSDLDLPIVVAGSDFIKSQKGKNILCLSKWNEVDIAAFEQSQWIILQRPSSVSTSVLRDDADDGHDSEDSDLDTDVKPLFSSKPPSSRQDFWIAIICALPLECDAVTLLFDQFWDEEDDTLGRASGDINTYITGRIGTHNVVLVLIPSLGKESVAMSAASLQASYPDLIFAILVGICGGVPNVGAGELLLGDVVISESISQRHLVRQFSRGFVRKSNHQQLRSKELRDFFALLEAETGNDILQRSTAQYLKQLQRTARDKRRRQSYSYPGFAEDKLFEASYRHKHWGNSPCEVCNLPGQTICDEAAQESCAKLGCNASQIVRRERLEEKKNLRREKAQRPAIFTGRVASGDTVLNSGDERDRIAKELGVIAFDMGENELSEELPCVIIKGVCDYADGHNNKIWQPFAAATAAAAAKALLARYMYSQPAAPNIRNLMRDLRITDPRNDKRHIEEAKGGLFLDSYRWILDNAEFRQWLNGEREPLLWIEGNPGTGKTMLLCGIINELQSRDSILVSFSFCQRNDSLLSSATAVLRGIIYLLIDQYQQLASHVQQQYESAGQRLFSDANAFISLSRILGAILVDPNLPSTYLIIDALDECYDGQPMLLDLISRLSAASPQVKWLISSRHLPSIDMRGRGFEKLSLEINQESIYGAVNDYVLKQVDRLAKLNSYDRETKDAIQHALLSNAEGTFLWVAFACRELARVSRRNGFERLKEPPSGLYEMYTHMMEQVRDSEHWKLCIDVLGVVAVADRSLALEELMPLIDPLHGVSNLEHLADAIELCGSFLTIRQDAVCFIHTSAKEFLLEQLRELEGVFGVRIGDTHYSIFSCSLKAMARTLRRDVYGLGDPACPVTNVVPPNPDPLAAVRYCCLHWMEHLKGIGPSKLQIFRHIIRKKLNTFFRKHFLNWLEALSLLKGISKVNDLEQVLSCIYQREGLPLFDTILDSLTFAKCHREIIESTPLQVYASALIFSPSHSITKRCYQQGAPEWTMKNRMVTDDWLSNFQGDRDNNHYLELSWSWDGSMVAASRGDGIEIWDAATGEGIITLEGHLSAVRVMAWLPHGQLSRLATASDDNTIKIWDPLTGACILTFEGHFGAVRAVAWSSHDYLASSSDDKTIKIWDIFFGACARTLEGHLGAVCAVAWSSSGQLASSSDDKTIKIWNPLTGVCVQTFEGHFGAIRAVDWLSIGRLVSLSDDKTVKIWDITTGMDVLTFTIDGMGFNPQFTKLGPRYLQTATGVLDLESDPATPAYMGLGLDASREWIMYYGRKVLRLPPQVRPSSVCILGPRISIGSSLGVTILTYKEG